MSQDVRDAAPVGRTNGATPDLSVTRYLYSAQQVRVNHPSRGQQRRPALVEAATLHHVELLSVAHGRGSTVTLLPVPTGGRAAAAAVKCRKLAGVYRRGLN